MDVGAAGAGVTDGPLGAAAPALPRNAIHGRVLPCPPTGDAAPGAFDEPATGSDEDATGAGASDGFTAGNSLERSPETGGVEGVSSGT